MDFIKEENYYAKLTPLEKLKWDSFLNEQTEVAKRVVTPEIAAIGLKTSPGNRPTIKNSVEQLVYDIESGKFYPGNDAVLIDPYRRLRNAHHRWEAIWTSNVPQVMIVRKDVPEEELLIIDTGRPRQVAGTNVFEKNTELRSLRPSTLNKYAAVVRAVCCNGHKEERHLSNHVVLDGINYFMPQLNFIYQETEGLLKATKLSGAYVVAPFLKAHYVGVDAAKLRYALNYLSLGGRDIELGLVKYQIGTFSIRALRDHLLDKANLSGTEIQKDVYLRSSRTLKAFLDGQEMQKAGKGQSDQDFFPIDIEALPFIPKNSDALSKAKHFGMPLIEALTSFIENQQHGSTFCWADVASYLLDNGFLLDSKNPKDYLMRKLGKNAQLDNGVIKFRNGTLTEVPGKSQRKKRFMLHKNPVAA